MTGDVLLPWVTYGRGGSDAVFRNISMPLTHALYQFEKNGIYIDMDIFTKLDEEYRERIGQLEQEFWQIAGSGVNYNSTQQLQDLLYNQLGLPVVRTTDTRAPSTDKETLELLERKHPVVKILKELRISAKIKGMFLAGWGNSEGLFPWIMSDGRVHTEYGIERTDTGRPSSSSPNMQNITRDSDVRGMFRAPPGMAMIEGDYSQAELRILAELSGDEVLRDDIQDDLHKHTAADIIYHVPLNEVTKEQRTSAKPVNFSIPYGTGKRGLAIQAKISEFKAERYLKEWWEKYFVVRDWRSGYVREAKKQGYADNEYGRRRHLEDFSVLSENGQIMHLERVTANFPMQSTCADTLSLATIQLALYSETLRKLKAKPILSLHDALYFEVPERHAVEAAHHIKETMETIPKILLGEHWDLPVELKVGYHWGDDSIAKIEV